MKIVTNNGFFEIYFGVFSFLQIEDWRFLRLIRVRRRLGFSCRGKEIFLEGFLVSKFGVIFF